MSKVVVADYDYDGEDESQLTFKEGDRIVVLEEDETGWWTGRLEKNGDEGYFPATYIKPIDEDTEIQYEDEEEYEEVAIADAADDENARLQVSGMNDELPSESRDDDTTSTKKVNNKRYRMQKTKSVSKDEDDLKEKSMPKTNGSKEGKAEGTTTHTTGQTSDDIDYNNYFANAQKIVSIPDNYEGDDEGGADMENYYAAEVLNLKFNPNAKTRYGMHIFFFITLRFCDFNHLSLVYSIMD